jgi:hypothetical protein
VHAIMAVDGGAAAARLAFVAGCRCVVEVMAARTLEEIAACRRHTAELLRGTGHDRAGENRITLLDKRAGSIRTLPRGVDELIMPPSDAVWRT